MKKHAVMLYVVKNGKILFLVRDKKNETVHLKGKLIAIGGKIEDGESSDDAIRREAREEAGIEVGKLNLRAMLYFRKFGTDKNDWITFLYTASTYKGKITNGKEGNFIWKNFNEIDKADTYSQDKLFLKLIFKYNFFVLEFLCDSNEMVEYKILKAL